MPFSITTQSFGTLFDDQEPLTEYLLQSEKTGEFVSILPGYGGIARRLVLRKASNLYALLKTPESAQALAADETYASALLFPYPSRIRHGIYNFEGEAYALKLNETAHDNSIHGFVHGRPFTVVSQEANDNLARLTLRYDYAGDTVGYPFPFALTITYELVRADQLGLGSNSNNDRMCSLRINYSVHNTGQKRCPAAFGWHPYFSISDEPVDGMILSIPARQPIRLNENLLPDGRDPLVNAEMLSLNEREMDAAFAIEPTGIPADGNPFAETVLTSPKSNVHLIVGQEMGEGKLNYLVCYTPARRDSIAIEPLTSNVNAFNNGEGLIVLNPGEIMSGTMWVRLE